MKRIIAPAFLTLALASCGGAEEQKETKIPTKDTTQASAEAPKNCKKGYDSEATTIGFGAFKTTERKEVKGTFTEFNIDSTVIGDTPEEIFANAVFSIPVSSTETNDEGRNQRIKSSYFGKMESTDLLTGKVLAFNTDSNTVDVELTINGVTNPTSLNYIVSGDTITLEGNIDILNFDGTNALEAMNEACEALHKGADGVSKTWPDVNLYVSSIIKEACE